MAIKQMIIAGPEHVLYKAASDMMVEVYKMRKVDKIIAEVHVKRIGDAYQFDIDFAKDGLA